MVKIVFFTIAFVLIISSVGLCAVANPDAGVGDMQAGYNYYGFNQKSNESSRSGVTGNEIYGNVGIGFGYGFFTNRLQAEGVTYTDIGITTGLLIPRVSLLVGHRQTNSDGAGNVNELFYGATFSQSISPKLSAEITYQKGAHFTTEICGISYDVTNFIHLGLGWKRNVDDNNKVTLKGVGGGLQLNF